MDSPGSDQFFKKIFPPAQINRVYVHSSKKKKSTRMDFESKESKEMKNLSTSEKKVPRPYEFSSYEIHRTKNLFGVA